MLSIDRQTTEYIVGMDSEDFPSFSRNEPLRLLLAALAVNDEEDELLSSVPRIRRENISLVQYRSNSFFPWERFLVKSQQVLFFVVFAFAFDRHAKSFSSFRHRCDAGSRAKMANIKQGQQMIPLIACEIPFVKMSASWFLVSIYLI